MKRKTNEANLSKTWEGIPLNQKIAEVRMKEKDIEGCHCFKTCLKNIKEDPKWCTEKEDCIIGKLVVALHKRGAKL